jgi:hypothetical protein
MNIRYYQPSDYETLCSWWNKHQHPIISSDILSNGIVVCENGNLICIGFVYLVNKANVAQLAWTTTNPEMSLRQRYKAVNMFFDGSISYINSLNIKNIMCFTDKPSLVKLLNRRGMRISNDHTLCIGSF